MSTAMTIGEDTPEDAQTSTSPLPDAPPLITGSIVPHLLDQTRRFRRMFFNNLQQLELEALQAGRRGRMIEWMDENYGDALKLAPKMMMKEPEAAPHATVEDLLEQLDKRAESARTIEHLPPASDSPSGSS